MKTTDSFILPEILKIDSFYDFKLQKSGQVDVVDGVDDGGEKDLRKAAVPLIGRQTDFPPDLPSCLCLPHVTQLIFSFDCQVCLPHPTHYVGSCSCA